MRQGSTVNRLGIVFLLLCAVVVGSFQDVAAQGTDLPGVSVGGGLMLRNLRPTGQPVIPIYDGWYRTPDGSFALCFGYHNLNLAEDLRVPLGPDNFIEPAELSGAQPTHFDEVPPGYRRRFCVFTVIVESLGDANAVEWTLRTRGEPLIAGATGSEYYRLDAPHQASRSVEAPQVQIEGLEQQFLGSHALLKDVGTIQVRAGERVQLGANAQVEGIFGVRDMVTRMLWTLHQGPAPVSFEESDAIVTGMDEVRHTTGAVFPRAGEYVIRLQAVDWSEGNPFGFFCCWTNAYFRVSVTQ